MEGEKSDNQKPSFGKKKCVDYFKAAFKSLSLEGSSLFHRGYQDLKNPNTVSILQFQPMLKLQELLEKLNREEAPVR